MAILFFLTIPMFLPLIMGGPPPDTIWFEKIPRQDSDTYGVSFFEQCQDGGLILVGSYANIYGSYYDAGVLLKLNPNGDLEWETRFGGMTMICYQVEELPSGSFIVVGGIPEYHHTWSLALMEFSATGDLLWNKSYDELAMSFQVNAVEDGYVVAGSPRSPTYGVGSEPFLVKMDGIGNFQWKKAAPIPMNGSYSLSFAEDGGYVLLGTGLGTQVLCKLDSSLDLVWQRHFTIANMSSFQAGAFADGSVWMTCSDPDFTSSPFENSTTMMLMDSSGNSVWNTTTFWGVRTKLLALPQKTADGGYIMGGQFVNPGVDLTGFIAKFNSTGSMVWVKRIEVQGSTTSVLWASPISSGYVAVGHIANASVPGNGIFAIKLADAEEPTTQGATIVFNIQGTTGYYGEVLNVDGVNHTATQLPLSITWSTGYSHNYSWFSPLVVSEGKRYTWSSSSGLSTERAGIIIAPSNNDTVMADYISQYYVSLMAATGGSITQSSGWYDASSNITITPVPALGYAFLNWEVSGNLSIIGSQGESLVVRVDGPGVLSPIFEAVDLITPTIAMISPANGSALTSGNITISASFSDNTGINASSAVLKIDGYTAAGIVATPTGMSYTTTLQGGTHNVELTVKDTYGNPQTVTWSFTTPQLGGGLPLEYLIATIITVMASVGLAVFLMRRAKNAPAIRNGLPSRRSVRLQ